MIDVERLEKFISHPDQRVRREVMDYIEKNWIQDSDIVDLAFDSCQTYGCVENLFAIYKCTHIPLNHQQTVRLWQMLKNSKNILFKIHAARLINNATLNFLENHIKVLKKQGASRYFKAATARIKYKDASPEQVWSELKRYSDSRYGKQSNSAYVDVLVDMLAKAEYPPSEELLKLMTDEEIEGQWLEVFLIELAAKRNLEQAIGIINQKMHIDDDTLASICQEALGRFSSEAVLDIITDDFEKKPWEYQLYACGVFDRIRLDQTEDAIISLLEKKDVIPHDIYCFLCFSLCGVFSEQAFKWGRTIIDDVEALTYDNMKERLIVADQLMIFSFLKHNNMAELLPQDASGNIILKEQPTAC